MLQTPPPSSSLNIFLILLSSSHLSLDFTLSRSHSRSTAATGFASSDGDCTFTNDLLCLNQGRTRREPVTGYEASRRWRSDTGEVRSLRSLSSRTWSDSLPCQPIISREASRQPRWEGWAVEEPSACCRGVADVACSWRRGTTAVVILTAKVVSEGPSGGPRAYEPRIRQQE